MTEENEPPKMAALRKRILELEDTAYGDATARILGPIGQIRHLHTALAAQMSRADTLNRLCREHRARIAELEKGSAEIRAKALLEGAAAADARTESHTVAAVADVLRRMAGEGQ